MKFLREHPVMTALLKAVVAIALLAALAHYLDLRELSSSISGANPWFLLAGLVLAVGNVLTQGARWKFLLRMVDPAVSSSGTLASLLVGFAAGFFTPGQLGEYGGRVIALPQMRAPVVIALGFIDKLYILALTLLMGGAAAVYYFHSYHPEYWNLWYDGAIGIAAVLLVFGLLKPRLLTQLRTIAPKRIAASRSFQAVVEVEHLLRGGMGITLSGLTLLYYLVILLQYHLFVLAFSHVALAASVASVGCVLLVKSVFIPITIGDLGVRETTAVFFFSGAGVAAATAFNASICVFFANIFLPSLAGAVMILRLRPHHDGADG